MKYGSRKFILSVLIVVLSAVLSYFGKMDASAIGLVYSAVIASYSYANMKGHENGKQDD